MFLTSNFGKFQGAGVSIVAAGPIALGNQRALPVRAQSVIALVGGAALWSTRRAGAPHAGIIQGAPISVVAAGPIAEAGAIAYQPGAC